MDETEVASTFPYSDTQFTAVSSPGPLTLLSSYSIPDSCSLSQLLSSPSDSIPENYAVDSSAAAAAAGLDVDFNFKLSRPTGLEVTQPHVFTVPPGLSPATLLHSPGFYSSLQAALGISHESFSAVPAVSGLLPSASSTARHQQISTYIQEPDFRKESSDLSNLNQRYQPSLPVDKPADDGYNWRKYGQKQVKKSEYPRSYYKCTHLKCPVTKKVERSVDGHVTEIIYKGQHNHQPPRLASNLQRNIESGLDSQTGSLSKLKGVSAYSLSMKDNESSQVTPEHLSGSSDTEDVGHAETIVDEQNKDEPIAKRRNTEVGVLETTSSNGSVTEPRIIVQTTSEVDLLDDGYRWRKYGQKVVKGNPYPRSYYKCTSLGCKVRKHVERAASDRKAVLTAYEGKHNHDVPAAKNSSHTTANNNGPNLKPHNVLENQHTSHRRTEFPNNDQHQIERLREEIF